MVTNEQTALAVALAWLPAMQLTRCHLVKPEAECHIAIVNGRQHLADLVVEAS